jgi:hypothetical protein
MVAGSRIGPLQENALIVKDALLLAIITRGGEAATFAAPHNLYLDLYRRMAYQPLLTVAKQVQLGPVKPHCFPAPEGGSHERHNYWSWLISNRVLHARHS